MNDRFNHYWYKNIRNIVTLKDMLSSSVDLFGDNPAFWVKEKKGAPYKSISYKLLENDVKAIGTMLAQMGVGKKIAVMGQGSYEWICTYLAIVNSGNIAVPIDKELSGAEIENLLKASECDTVFCTKGDCKKLYDIKGLENLIVMEIYGDRTDETASPVYTVKDFSRLKDKMQNSNVTLWKDLLLEGEELLKNGDTSFESIEIDPDEMTVILFTSGTTGIPKGVVLSHRNITSNIMDVCRVCHVKASDKTLSLLPIHHTYECTLGMLLILYRGASTAFCEGMKYIPQNMKEAENTIIIVVPRVLEMLHGRISKSVKKQGKEKLFRNMLNFNRRLKRLHINAGRKIFKSVIDEMGGKLRIVITGAAAISPQIYRDFEDMGLTILQGYGMTECTPLISGTPQKAERERYRKAGSVGATVSTGETKVINKDESGIGEILYRGPNVMKGYYNMPEATAEVIDEEGWLHTGDLGFIDPQGWIYLTGRVKNVIVTVTGENVYPEEIEEFVNQNEFIEDSMIFPHKTTEGENVGIQILPAMEPLSEKFGYEPNEEELNTFFKDLINELNQDLSVYKRIRDVFVRKEDFIRTTTKKIKRQDNMM
ncbi:AMP-binding enzyme [Eubacterium nodatum ATCC 33099]|nr:AMP-binding enzyme [Eubacterium nodatum ATCC 33099]